MPRPKKYLTIVTDAGALAPWGAAAAVSDYVVVQTNMQIRMEISNTIDAGEPPVFMIEETQTNRLFDAAKLFPAMSNGSSL